MMVVLDSLPVRGRAIDLGSGVGRIVHHLRNNGWVVEGCELHPAKAAMAQVDARDVLEWQPTSSAELVTCMELIEHLPLAGQVALLKRIRSWVTDGGWAVLSTPQRHSPVALFERSVHFFRPHLGPYQWWDPTHVSVLPRHQLERMLSDAGFVVEDRVGVHYAPDLVPIPRLNRKAFRGPLSALGWDLIYILR